MDNKPVDMESVIEEVKRSRAKREMESRELNERPKQWMPASVLPEPEREAGYSYRWVRISNLGQSDPLNISAKFREGWEPVRKEEQPSLAMLTDKDSRFADNIEVAGLLLCKIPTSFMDQRREHFANLTKSQMDSVDNNLMRQNDPRMPLFSNKKSKVSFGSGN